MKRGFDRIARPYERLERLAFGGLLSEARLWSLDKLPAPPRNALLLGDGDGRFLCTFLQRFPDATAVSIDSSQGMIDRAKQRLAVAGIDPSRCQFTHADATAQTYPENAYDLIAVNFFLDCLTQSQVDALLPQLESSLALDGAIAYADFTLPESGPNRALARLGIRALYLLFWIAASLRTRRLPEIRWSESINPIHQKTWLGGALVSQVIAPQR